jgi:hypothetical protein
MPRQQSGYIWKVGGSWYGRWREDVLEESRVIRKQRSVKLADVSDRYRTKADVRPLLAEKLRPINEGRHGPRARCQSLISSRTSTCLSSKRTTSPLPLWATRKFGKST